MNCPDAWEALEEYRRGELPSDAAAAVEAHLRLCAPCRRLRDRADALAALIRTLPRPAAPAGLARAVRDLERRRPPRLSGWLARPWVAAALAAVLVAAVLAPWLEFRGRRADDPVERLLQGGVAEHRRIVLQLEGRGTEVSDPQAEFARIRSLTTVELPPVLAGDAELTLLEARPTVIAERKAAAVALRDPGRLITTCFALPAMDLPMPSEGRVQIEQYRPYMRQMNGLNLVYWKQGEYAWLMVSDRDDPGTRELFLKMRKAL